MISRDGGRETGRRSERGAPQGCAAASACWDAGHSWPVNNTGVNHLQALPHTEYTCTWCAWTRLNAFWHPYAPLPTDTQPCKMKIMFIDGACLWMCQAESLSITSLRLATGWRKPSSHPPHLDHRRLVRISTNSDLLIIDSRPRLCLTHSEARTRAVLCFTVSILLQPPPPPPLHFDSTRFLLRFADFNSRHTPGSRQFPPAGYQSRSSVLALPTQQIDTFQQVWIWFCALRCASAIPFHFVSPLTPLFPSCTSLCLC